MARSGQRRRGQRGLTAHGCWWTDEEMSGFMLGTDPHWSCPYTNAPMLMSAYHTAAFLTFNDVHWKL